MLEEVVVFWFAKFSNMLEDATSETLPHLPAPHTAPIVIPVARNRYVTRCVSRVVPIMSISIMKNIWVMVIMKKPGMNQVNGVSSAIKIPQKL